MNRDRLLKNAGLAAVILLAPGGFVLGATLLTRHLHRRRTAGTDASPEAEPPPDRG